MSSYPVIKRNKGFILIYACIIIMLVFILITFTMSVLYYNNLKVIKREEQLETYYYLEGSLLQLSSSSFKSNVGKGYITTTRNINYKIDVYDESSYIIIGYNLKYPAMKKYLIFHNGFADKTDYDYRIIEEGYIIENE